jgi:serine/threonine-protein kinase
MTTETTESPRKLGRYELVHLLGQGGMGEVFLAKISGAAGFEKPCIVKTILPSLLKDRQFLDRFHHEAKVLVHLVHSSIAQVYDMGEANGTYYMALEYVAGVDVAYLAEQAREKGQAIPPAVALYLGQRMSEGLGYAHRKAGPDGTPLGIVHRDVSPHNVMVSYEGEVKVIDFGLAKSAARSKYTLPATVMGKLGYMSPEQARAEPLDHRSDIYSAGVVVWELIAGRPLISHGTVGEMMAAMANPAVPALHELRGDVDAALDAVVRRALASRPEDRYARADDFARALNEQLLRASGSLGAEEVGNFVKALCPEAFSAQRKLLSGISGVRRPPSGPVNTGVVAVSELPPGLESLTGLEATSVRPLSDMQADSSQAPIRPVVSPLPGALVPAAKAQAEVGHAATLVPQRGAAPGSGPTGVALPQSVEASQAAAHAASAHSLHRWRTAALVLGALVLVGGSVIGTLLFVRGRGSPPVVVVQSPGGPHEGGPGGPGGPHDHRPPFDPSRPPPPGFPPPPGPPPPAPDAHAVHRGPPPGGPGGEVVAAAGTEGSATANPAVAAEGSVEATPAVAKLPEDPSRSSEPQWITVKGGVAPVLSKSGVFFVPRGATAGIRVGRPMKIVGPEREGGDRQLLGVATPIKVMPRRAQLELDAAAASSSQARFAVLPELVAAPPPVATAPVPAPEPALEPAELEVPTPPAPAAPPRTLQGGVKKSSFLGLGAIDKGLTLRNAEDVFWWNCKATLAGQLQLRIKRSVPKKGELNLDRGDFKIHADAPIVEKNQLHLECDEGTATFPIQR